MGANLGGLGGGDVPAAVAAYLAQNGLGQGPTSGKLGGGGTGVPGGAAGGMLTPLANALKGNNPVQAPGNYHPWGGPVEGGWGQEFDRLHRWNPQKGDLMVGSGPYNPATGEAPPGGWSIENHQPLPGGGGSSTVLPGPIRPIENLPGYTGGGGSTGGGGGGYTGGGSSGGSSGGGSSAGGGGGGSTGGGVSGGGSGSGVNIRPGGGNSGKGGVYGGNAWSSDWTNTPGSQDLGPPAGWSGSVQGYATNTVGYDPQKGWVLPSAWSDPSAVTRSGYDQNSSVGHLAMQYAQNNATPEAPRTDLPPQNPGEDLYAYAQRVGFPASKMGSLGMAVGNMPADMPYGEKLDRVLNPRGYMTDAELANDRAAVNIILKSYPRTEAPSYTTR